jgi:lipoyl(octanoyl) transferase
MTMGGSSNPPVEWVITDRTVAYPAAVMAMEARVERILAGEAPECVWLLEHPPLYTAGISAKTTDLLTPGRFPVFESGRGGQYTYHGPGQRIAYTMLDVRRRGRDVRGFVEALEGWLIDTLAAFNVRGELRPGRVGIWVARPSLAPGREDKIAALGVRVRRGVAFHGVALNVEPDLTHFDGIVPCGIRDQGVTSLVDLGHPVAMTDVDQALRCAFEDRFGAETHTAGAV